MGPLKIRSDRNGTFYLLVNEATGKESPFNGQVEIEFGFCGKKHRLFLCQNFPCAEDYQTAIQRSK